jgi:hypothetical protein
MPKSNRNGFSRSGATVSVIDARVHRSYARTARIGFTVAALVTSAISMTIASAYTPPILAVLIGLLAGMLCGAVVFAAVRIWPIARIFWWWLPELATVTVLLWLWSLLATHTPIAVRAIVMTAVLGSLMLRWTRTRVVAVLWCLVVRHRLRSCFAQFIVANRSGSLPLILGARPTPVGERVWIYLRPGLSPTDLDHCADKIAVACHAASVIVECASTRTAALVRLDIKRREVLGGMVANPLAGLITPAALRKPGADTPEGLDLDQVPEAAPRPAKAARALPATAAPKQATVTRLPAVPAGSVVRDGEDVSDWID